MRKNTERLHDGDLENKLITPQGKKVLIEIKLSNAPTLSAGFFEVAKDVQADYTYLITPDSHNYQREDGLHVLPLMGFLKIELVKMF